MPTLYCSRCSRLISFDGAPPGSCPDCGFTFDNAADSTDFGGNAGRLPETMTAILPAGRAIGRYEVQHELGAGAFGTVYLAHDPKLDRLVAIKCPNERIRHNPEFLERLAREGRNAAQLHHPSIVTVHDVEENEDGPYIVSEFINGETLSRYLRRGRLSFRAAASMVAAIAAAVQYAHSKKIVHRDIKPSNVMVDDAGNPRLMDFGLAKREDIDETVTVDNQILGTVAYMSPEQLAGKSRGIDYRTDIYSLGVLLYQLLTEKLPFRSDAGRLRTRILNEEAPRPRTLDKQIPIDLQTICLKAMERDRERRYQTAGELAEDLERWLRGEPIVARHIGRAERAWRWAKRNPAPAALIASVALLLAVSTVGALAYAGVAKDRQKTAEESRDKEFALRKLQEQATAREAEARKNAEAAERRIQEALDNNRELLSRAYVERGERYLRARESSDEYDPIKALPWMLAAMKLDEKNSQRLLVDRIRLQTQLDVAPRVEKMWFFRGGWWSAGLSPKGDMFYVAASDGTVDVWRIAKEGAPRFSLAHPGPVATAAFSPDGKVLATGSLDGVRLWSMTSGLLEKGPFGFAGRQARRLQSGREAVFPIVFSQSGRLLFAADTSGAGQVWKVETAEPVGAPISGEARIREVAFADSDRLLLVSRVDRTTHFHHVESGMEEKKAPPWAQQSLAVKVSPDGMTIAVSGLSDEIRLWNVGTGKPIGEPLANEAGSPRSSNPVFSPNSSLLATGSMDGAVRLWSASTGRLVWRRQVFSAAADHVQFSPDGSLLFAANIKKKLCVLAVPNGRLIAQPINFVTTQHCVDWTDSPDEILTAGGDGVARLWNINTRAHAFQLPLPGPVQRAGVSTDRRVLAVVESDDSLRVVRSSADGRLEPNRSEAFPVGDIGATALALTRDGSRIAISDFKQVSVWDARTHKRLVGPLQHGEVVNFMQFTPDGRLLVCVAYDGNASVWEVATGRRLYAPLDVGGSKGCWDLDIDPAGKRGATAATAGVTIWDLATGNRLRPGFLGDKLALHVRFLKDPNRVLIAWQIRRGPIIWDTTTAQPVCAITKPSYVQCVAVSADRSQFLTGDENGTARLWSSDTATPASPPFEHPAAVREGIVDPTGRFVLTFADDYVFLWHARSAELVLTFSLRAMAPAFPLSGDTPQADPSVAIAFFAPDGRAAHIVAGHGLVITIPLDVDARPAEQLARDVAIQSGSEFDGAGGMRVLDPRELSAAWKARGGLTTEALSDPSRTPMPKY